MLLSSVSHSVTVSASYKIGEGERDSQTDRQTDRDRDRVLLVVFCNNFNLNVVKCISAILSHVIFSVSITTETRLARGVTSQFKSTAPLCFYFFSVCKTKRKMKLGSEVVLTGKRNELVDGDGC